MKRIYLFTLFVFLLQISFAQKGTKKDTKEKTETVNKKDTKEKTKTVDKEDTKEKTETVDKKETKKSLLSSKKLFVEAYKLNPFKAPDSVRNVFETFKILDKRTLNNAQIEIIKTLLNNDSSFLPDDVVKYCAFFPKMGLSFIDKKKRDTLNVVMAFGCDKIRFYKEHDYFVRQSDPASEQFYNFYKNVFESVAYNTIIVKEEEDKKETEETETEDNIKKISNDEALKKKVARSNQY